ncbi:hypothetical protein, partial [Streptomyces hirsutus]|uniref:hypothetical protein n=1 Tax=Streptomyces hirsutus TaxID=35620 RepID=UPI001B805994
MAKRRVRYVMPVMVEVDYDDDQVTRVVTLPEEVREDRDDMSHFLSTTSSSSAEAVATNPRCTPSAWANPVGPTTGSGLAARRTGRSDGRRVSAGTSPTIDTRRSTRTTYASGRSPLGPVLPKL